jgi:hypothetical protein
VPALVVPAFALSWWAACYLIGRDPRRVAPQRAAAALVAYGISVVLWTVAPDSAAAQIFVCVPALFWAGAAIGLLPDTNAERRHLDKGWLIVSGVVLIVVVLLPRDGRLVALAPLAGALVLLWRARARVRPPMLPAALAVAAVLYAVALAVILRRDGGYDSLVLAAIGVDLLMLGFLVSVAEALDLGERLRPDLVRAMTAGVAGSIVAGGLAALTIIAADAGTSVTILQYALVAVVMTLIGLTAPVNRGLDTVAFFHDSRLRASRSGLLQLGLALPRRRQPHRLLRTSEEDFVRFTRYALDNFRDDGRLMRSPLIELPAVDRRVSGRTPEEPLARVTALRALLGEAVDRLRPPGQFSTGDPWHHYSALHFCNVLGVDPTGRRLRTDGLDREARQALSWMHQYVPRRVLRRWQVEGARVVATRLRDDFLSRQTATRR